MKLFLYYNHLINCKCIPTKVYSEMVATWECGLILTFPFTPPGLLEKEPTNITNNN